MNSLVIGIILVFFLLGTGLIGALVAAWEVEDVKDIFSILYTIGMFYTLADVTYILGIS